MTQPRDSDGVSLCSDTDETLMNQYQDQGTLLPKNDETKVQDSSDRKSIISTTTLNDSPTAQGEPAYPSIWSQLLFDLLLTLPAVAFTIYGILVAYHDGESIDTKPVSVLTSASNYGPTIFPIAFAAVAANFLKSIAAWKLERGIDVLNLELLLRSRTVFSSIASPISLKDFNRLNIFLMALWALSPLGGQAALRVTGMGSSTNDWEFWCLDVRNDLPYDDYQESLLTNGQAQAIAAFSAALSSPIQIKNAKQDLFGHAKIPMIEPYLTNGTADEDGWYQVDDADTTTTYCALAGLPMTPDGGFELHSNYKFRLKTPYMNTKCHLTSEHHIESTDWALCVAGRPIERPVNITNEEMASTNAPTTFVSAFSNNKTLVIESPPRMNFSSQPRELIFTSYTERARAITNATCSLRTTEVELELACDQATCRVTRIRPVNLSNRDTFSTVLDGQAAPNSPYLVSQSSAFLKAFVNSSIANLEINPIQAYFIDPSSPFDTPYDLSFISDSDFSLRFAQLLNTFWVVSVAPSDALNNSTLQEQQSNSADMAETAPDYISTDGTKITSTQSLKVNRVWLCVLMIASLSMLVAALAAAILNTLRRGPDILDNPIRLMKDSPYMQVGSETTSMENGVDHTRRMKHVRICLGDVKSDEKLGYIAIGTMDEVVPLSKQDYTRLYR